MKQLKSMILLLGVFLISSSAIASHFRHGTISWRVVSGNTIEFKISQAWANFGNWSVGQTGYSDRLYFGDGQSATFAVVATAVNAADNWYYGETTITHTYANAGNFNAYFASCCKIGGLSNNAHASWRNETIVNVGNGNESPVTTMAPIINMQTGLAGATFQVPATDPDGDNLTYRLATTAELANGSQPSGISIHPTTGVLTFNTIGKSINSLWNAAIVVEDGQTKVVNDFIIKIVQQSNPPVYDYTITPVNGFTYQVSPGTPINFAVKADDSDPGATVTLQAIGLPIGASFPLTGNNTASVTGNLSWTPSASDLGTNVINFIAQDNVGAQVNTSVSIIVSLKPQFDVPPTPQELVHNVYNPGQTISYTVQASDPDPLDVVQIVSVEGKNMAGNAIPLYANASFSPLPSASGNPTSGTFSWTTQASDWGHRHVFFTAQDSYGDQTVHEVAQLINTPPAFTSTPNSTADVGQPYSHIIQVSDADIPYGDVITIMGNTLPGWLTLTDNGNGTATLSGIPSVSDVGSNSVNIQAEDLNHHQDPRGVINQAFTITVNNCTVSAVAQNLTVFLDGNGSATITAADIDGGSSASCGIDTMSIDVTSFTCADIGSHTVTITITDIQGNTSSSNATVTVVDNELPNTICQNITVPLGSNGTASISAGQLNNGSTDNCGVATVSASQTFFTTADLGPNSVTLTVTDVNGNSSTCAATVTVVDYHPVISIDNSNVICGPGSPVTINSTNNAGDSLCWIDPNSAIWLNNTGNQSIINGTTIPSFDFAFNGNDQYVAYANSYDYFANAQKYDGTSWSQIGQSDFTPKFYGSNFYIRVANGTPYVAYSEWNSTLDVRVAKFDGTSWVSVPTTGLPAGYSLGFQFFSINNELYIGWRGQVSLYKFNGSSWDQVGNTVLSTNANSVHMNIAGGNTYAAYRDGSNSWKITVKKYDGTAWTTVGPAGFTATRGNSPKVFERNGVPHVAYIKDPSGAPAGTLREMVIMKYDGINWVFVDNVGSAPVYQVYMREYNGNQYFAYPDGNSVVQIIEFDGIATSTYMQANLGSSNIRFGMPNGVPTIGYITYTGGSKVFSATQGTPPCLGNGTSFVANQSGSYQLINYVDGIEYPSNVVAVTTDTVLPTASCQDITVQLDANGNASITAADIDNGSSDNCGISSLTIDINSFGCADVGSNTVTLTVTDSSGNSATCTATATVLDTIAPTMASNSITLNLVDRNTHVLSQAEIDQLGANSFDNCAVNFSISAHGFDCGDVGQSFTLTLTGTDPSGNTADVPVTVSITDVNSVCNDPPVAVCQDITIYTGANCDASITAADVDGGSSDPDGDALTFTVNNSGPFGVGTHTVTLSVFDGEYTDSCTAVVTVVDSTAPTAVCQDVTVYLDAAGNASITAVDLDNGSSDACGIATLSIDNSSFNCADVNTSSAIQTIVTDGNWMMSTFEYPTPWPNVPFASNLAQLPAASTYTVAVQNVYPYGGTLVFTPTIAGAQPIFSNRGFQFFRTTFNLSAIPNSTEIQLTVDNLAEIFINGQSIANENNFNNSNNFGGTQAHHLFADNSGITNGYNGGDLFDVVTTSSMSSWFHLGVNEMIIVVANANGTDQGGVVCRMDLDVPSSNTVTLTATDVNGNSSTCTSNVTVLDTIPPSALCQNITVQLDATGNASITAADVDGGSSDACGIASLAIDNSSFTCADVGPNTVTLTVTDVNGNVSTCTSTITVEDNVLPVAICQDITVQLDASGNASITPADIDNGSSDACGISLAIDNSSFTCADVGPNTVTLTVTDNNGNVSTCTSTVTIEDNVLPVAICQDITVQLDASGNASITPADVDNGSSDACGISLAIDNSSFTCADVGPNTVTLTVTDNNGNVSTCTSTVTVEDNVLPIAICQDITVQLNASGNASITPADVDNGSSDACGISLAIDNSSFTCADVGANTVTLTVTDVNGNVSTCTSTVTVEDNVAPVAICQDITVQLDASGNASITPADVDNGSSDACGISLAIDNGSFTCADVGANTVTLTVTDVNGNVSTCTSTVTVEDNVAPVAICQDITVQLDVNGNASITPADIDNGSSDACGISLAIDNSTFSCADVGTNTVTLTVTDVNGNVSTCTSTVTVEDNIAPVASCQDITVYLDINGAVNITANDVDNTSNDACGVSLAIDNSSFGCGDVGANTVILTVTDPSGNASTCTSTVTVVDTITPTMVCANITVTLDSTGMAVITPADVDGGTWDACGIASLTIDNSSFNCADVGDNLVVLTATDVNGNVASCTATVYVDDPTLVLSMQGCSNDMTKSCEWASDPVHFNTPTASTISNLCGISCAPSDTSSCYNLMDPSNQIQGFVYLGRFNDKKYYCSYGRHKWPAAEAAAKQYGGHLVAINSAAENQFLKQALPWWATAWIGYSDDVTEGSFVWSNGDTSTYTNWSWGEPNNFGHGGYWWCGGADYAVIKGSNGRWYDRGYYARYEYVMEVPCNNSAVSVTQISGLPSGSVFPVGTTKVTFVALDSASGKTDTCSFNVTIEDDIDPPVTRCKNITVTLGADTTYTISASDIDKRSYDNCSGIASITASQTVFDSSHTGQNQVTLIVADSAGNVDSCQATVTVINPHVVTYCNASGHSGYEWIQKVIIAGQTNNSGNDNGYGDYTHKTFNLNFGRNNVQLTPGYAGRRYKEYWRIWIDFNNDGDFNDWGEKVYQKKRKGTINGRFSIPSYCPTGTFTMRIGMRYGGYPNSCGYCGYGEYEDYTVVLGSPSTVTRSLQLAAETEVEEVDNRDVTLFPNPTRGLFNVSLEGDFDEPVIVTIRSIQGKVIMEKRWNTEMESDRIQLDVSNEAKGMYFLQIRSGDYVKVIKFNRM